MINIYDKVGGASGKDMDFEVRLECIFQLQHLLAV